MWLHCTRLRTCGVHARWEPNRWLTRNMSFPSDRPTRPAGETTANSRSYQQEDEDLGFVSDAGEFDDQERPTLLNVVPPPEPASARGVETPQAYEVLADVIDKAVAVGNVNAIAGSVADRLAKLATSSSDDATISRQTVDAASRCAMKLASATGDGSWVNVVVRVYHARGEALPVMQVDRLYSMLRHVRGVDWVLLGGYVELLRERRGEMTPAERFVAKRIEGLLQLGPG